jgi:hypothetical protein
MFEPIIRQLKKLVGVAGVLSLISNRFARGVIDLRLSGWLDAET